MTGAARDLGPYERPANTPLRGDTNGDNKIDVADIVTVLTSMAHQTGNNNCDVNDDGEVNTADILTILTMIANGN